MTDPTPCDRPHQDGADDPQRAFVLTVVQPGLAGLMDGSVSTLAPIFAAAFATEDTWPTFLLGLAASVGAGVSMAFAEALSDDGRIFDANWDWWDKQLDQFVKNNAHLKKINDQLSQYLEYKRNDFARLYFISDKALGPKGPIVCRKNIVRLRYFLQFRRAEGLLFTVALDFFHIPPIPQLVLLFSGAGIIVYE